LAAGGNLDKNIPVIVLEVSRPSVDVEYAEQFLMTTMNEWYSPIWDYLTRGYLPQDTTSAKNIHRQSVRYAIIEETLLHKGYTTP
jgi:hypothetical protein